MISAGYKSTYQQGYSDAMCDFRKEPRTAILDKIRAEIEQFADTHCSGDDINIYDVFQILDKYKAESEGKE